MAFYPSVDVPVDVPLTKAQQAVYDKLPDPRKDDTFAKMLGVRMPGEEEELEDTEVQQLLAKKLDVLEQLSRFARDDSNLDAEEGARQSRSRRIQVEPDQRGELDPITGAYELVDIPSDDVSDSDPASSGGYDDMSDGRGQLAFDPGSDDDLSAELEAEEFADDDFEDDEPVDAGRWARARHGAVVDDDSHEAENEKEITDRALEELYDSQSFDWEEGFGGLDAAVGNKGQPDQQEMEDSYGASSDHEVNLQANIPEKKILETRDRPMGFMWKVNQNVKWDITLKRWFEFEDAVMIHFEEGMRIIGVELVSRCRNCGRWR